MAEHTNLGRFTKAALGRNYKLTRNEIGEDARLSKLGMVFTTKSYDVRDIGHFCIMRLKAFGGMMKMETVILAPTGVDAPLMNVDWVSVFGKETQIVEFYDTQLSPWADSLQAEMRKIALNNKSGKGLTERLNRAAQAYIGVYCAQLAEVPACDSDDREEKRRKVKEFATKLFENGGQAVNMITKLFGEETARRVIIKHMYGA